MGTPEVAAGVLARLLDAAEQPDASFEVAAVVTQPARLQGRAGRGRGSRKGVQPSPVAALAFERGIAPQRIMAPETARDEAFLKALAALRPDLCVTAAYGNILPYAFLVVPRCGTLNVHPSLLPRYRGAAPVQRALQDGVAETGVSVAFTVKAMDAGPVLAREAMAVDPDMQAPELLEELFARGTRLLLRHLPDVLSERARGMAEPQDEAQASSAPKLAMEEGLLDFREPALTLHNKVRAFAGWPGTRHNFVLQARTGDGSAPPEHQLMELKVFHEEG
ncbi:hypothetical protein WJX81_006621 [Elliptochloris bilobata]|uniref:methionyl-tRNA formyltransferase n=1 Tax=Elliptochloris bilobata TaxID=381761 RepID=A0AAW1S890_9CHLO